MVWTLRRRTARLVLLDAGDHVLLLRARDPADPAKGQWWELPGGGLDPGESSEAAARRELYEETGLVDVEVGPGVWQHHVEFDFGGYHFDQNETIHLGRLAPEAARDIHPAGLEALEVDAFVGHRWVPAGELAGLTTAGERVIPHWLPAQLPAVLASGLPAEPIQMGEQSEP